MVSGYWGTASIAVMRPPVTAGPIDRASRPPKVFESTSVSAARSPPASARPASASPRIVLDVGGMTALLALRRLRRCRWLLGCRRRVGLLFGSRRFLLGRRRHREAGVGDARVELDLGDRHHHAAGHPRGLLLDGVREDQAVDGLEVAEHRLALDLLATDLGLAGLLEQHEILGVDVEESDVAALLGHLELVDRRALEVFLAHQLDGAS